MRTVDAARIVAVAAALIAGPALAQVPPDIAEKNRAIGRRTDVPASTAIYAPLQKQPPYAGVKVTRDVPYGPAPLNRLDVFEPEGTASEPRPVVVFVHGGAFVAGDKALDGQGRPSPFYDNIMLWAASQGLVGVNFNYVLAPAAQHPQVQNEIDAALAWVRTNISRHGGDPKRVFLYGHSAGATHVASYLAEKGAAAELSGAMVVSGTYRLDPVRDHVYFGAASGLEARSPLPRLAGTEVPMFVYVAELDSENAIAQAEGLRDALCAAGRCPEFQMLKDHGHMSIIHAVNTPDQSMTGPMAAFVRKHAAPK